MKDAGRINEYFNGMIEGVRLYAHWKNGEQFVGTTGKTLKQAIEQIEAERKEALE
jgi:hypothetical protein